MIKVAFFTFNPLQENTYLLSNEKGDTLIIDPGCYFEAEKTKLENYILQNGLKPVQLLNTHAHTDHIFGNKWIADTYGLEVYMHRAEIEIAESAPALARMFGLEYNAYTGIYHYLQEGDIFTFLGKNELKSDRSAGPFAWQHLFFIAKNNTSSSVEMYCFLKA